MENKTDVETERVCLALWNNDLKKWGILNDNKNTLCDLEKIGVHAIFDGNNHSNEIRKLVGSDKVMDYEEVLVKTIKTLKHNEGYLNKINIEGYKKYNIKKLLGRHYLNGITDDVFNDLLNRLYDEYRHFLESNRIEKIIYSEIPHTAFDYYFYLVAESLNIKNQAVEMISQFGRGVSYVFDMNNWKIEKAIEIKSTELNLIKIETIVIEATNRENGQKPYSEEIIKATQQEIENGRKDNRQLMKMFVKDMKEGIVFFQWIEHRKELKRYLEKNSIEKFEKGKKYAIYFLHIEPEATVTPEAKEYCNQLKVIKELNDICKQKGLELIVKEHPDQFKPTYPYVTNAHWQKREFLWVSRNIEFYKKVQEIIGIRKCFISHMTNIKNVLDRDYIKLVGTLNGSIGLEAYILGIDVYAYGYPWYGGINSINTPNNKQKKLGENESYIIKTNELNEARGLNNIKLIIDICEIFNSAIE